MQSYLHYKARGGTKIFRFFLGGPKVVPPAKNRQRISRRIKPEGLVEFGRKCRVISPKGHLYGAKMKRCVKCKTKRSFAPKAKQHARCDLQRNFPAGSMGDADEGIPEQPSRPSHPSRGNFGTLLIAQMAALMAACWVAYN